MWKSLAFVNAIKHLVFCFYWCNWKNMTDVTYGQFFWALSLPFILEKKEVLTFMLFLQGCWMREKKKKGDICERILWSTKCHIACIPTARQTCWWSLSWTVFIRGCQLQGNRAFLFLLHTLSPRTKHCARYTIGAGWISTGPDRPFGNRSGNFSPYKENIQGLLLFFSLKAQWHHCKSYQNRKWNNLSQTVSLWLETLFPVSWHPIETLERELF